MTNQNPITDANMALLDIQNNLKYIEKELTVENFTEEDITHITQLIRPYYGAVFDCLEELAAIGQEQAVFIIDPLLNELTDDKTPRERTEVILGTLRIHNGLLTDYTNSIVAAHDTLMKDTAGIETDMQLRLLLILMTESVGNILHLSHFVTKTLNDLTTNN